MLAPAEAVPTVRIILADDHDLVLAGTKALLSKIPGVTVVAEARSGTELVAAVDAFQPDIVMTDINMPGMDGLTAMADLHARHPEVRLFVLSASEESGLVRRSVASGACGYLTKGASPLELTQAIRSVMANGTYFSGLVARQLLRPADRTVEEELTGRQIQVLTLLAQGLASKQIAFKLGLSSKTVDVHRFRLMERLDLHDIAGLTRYAIRNNLVAL